MAGTIAPVGRHQFFDDTGDPLAGGTLTTETAGTSVAEPTYSDSALLVPNANPIVLDAAGRATIFLSGTSYKWTLRNSAGVTVWTQDNIQAVNASSPSIMGGVLGSVFTFAGDPTSPVTDAAYPVGTTYDKLHAGTTILSLDSANLAAGTFVLEGMILGGGGTVTAALVNLSDGSPETPLVTIASSHATGERVVSGAIAFAAAGAAKLYGVKVRTTAGSGNVWGLRLVRSA